MISYRISCFTPVKPSESTSRQQTAIRRSQALIVRPSNIQFHQLSTNCIQRTTDRPSPILVRRIRPTIEHFSAHRQPADLQDMIGSQLHFMRSTPSAVQQQPSPRTTSARSKPVQYSKTMPEKTLKMSQPLQTPIWAPIFTRKQIVPFQTARSKSVLSKYFITPQYHQFPSEKKPPVSDVVNAEEESVRQNPVKDLVEQWEDQKSNVAVSSEDDDDDSVISNCNNPLLIFTSTFDQFASPIFIPQQCSSSSTNNQLQRRPLNFYLPPVVEDANDEIIDCKEVEELNLTSCICSG